MTDPNLLGEPDGTPEDVATLYSWANLHGAKYRDFSAARAQTREKARLRAEQAVDEERRTGQDEVEAPQATEAQQSPEQAEVIEAAHEAEQAQDQSTYLAPDLAMQQTEFAAEEPAHQAEQASQQAAEQIRQAVEQAAQQEATHAAQLADLQAAQQALQPEANHVAAAAGEVAAEQADHHSVQEAAGQTQAAHLAEQQALQRAAEQVAVRPAQRQAPERAAEQGTQQRAWQQPHPRLDDSPASFFPHTDVPHAAPPSFDRSAQERPQAWSQAQGSSHYQPHYTPAHEESSMPPRNPWTTPEIPETNGKPAWLTADRSEASSQTASQPPLSPAPDDTLQGSRDRLTSRWFALRGIFDAVPPPVEPVPAPVVSRAPAMAVFSLAGGVGKTSLVATLGRALSARGERVLLVDTAAFGLLPFFFGATDQRPGLLRTFSPPGLSSDAPIQMVTLDPDSLGNDAPHPESLTGEISKLSRGSSRVIVDLATASGSTTRRIMRMAPLVLVPVIPDMNSVVSVSSIDAFFEHNSNPNGKPALPFYVLNQFDASLPLHLDVREVLREQLAERLLAFALRRTPAMSEALAEGMTVMDYAPNSDLAEDFSTLAGWVKTLSAPATTSYRGVRWSER